MIEMSVVDISTVKLVLNKVRHKLDDFLADIKVTFSIDVKWKIPP